MATDFLVPTSAELRAVEMDLLPRLTATRACFDIFPMRDVDDAVLMWEQYDNWTGLQAARGLNGAPPRVKRTGAKRYLMEPGVYGDFSVIDEHELTRRRQLGSFDQVIDLTEPVATEQQRLLQRRLDRVELIIWTLLAQGVFSVAAPTGGVIHTDSYATQSFTASVPWATSATATPLFDLRTVQLLARGHSVRFNSDAKLYLNRTTANRIFTNTNAADLYGRRTAGLGTFNSPDQVNQLFMGDDLPQMVIYDDGYLDDTGTFNLFIPTGVGILVGLRPNNVPVGEYLMTRNANNPSLAPGSYMKVIDRGENDVPRSIEIHDGHNGGPAIYFPSAVVVMNV